MTRIKLNDDCGSRIRDARQSCNMTQKEVAESLNIATRSIIDYEKGYSKPNYEVLNGMSYLFKTSLVNLGLDLTYAQYIGIDIFRPPTTVMKQIPLYTTEDLIEIEIKHNRVFFPKLKPCNIEIDCPDISLFATRLEDDEMELVSKDGSFIPPIISFPKGSIVTFQRNFGSKESGKYYLVKLENQEIVFRKLYFTDDNQTLFVALNKICGHKTYYISQYEIIAKAVAVEINEI